MNELDKSLAKLVDATQKLAPDLVQAKAVEGYISVAVCAVFAIFGTVLCAKIYRYWKKTPEISDSIGVLMIIGVVASAFAIGTRGSRDRIEPGVLRHQGIGALNQPALPIKTAPLVMQRQGTTESR
jgi:hypothetical protein